MTERKNLIAAGIVTAAALITRLIFFGKPASVVFDETYFLKFIGLYWNGSYFFDVHPPFAKLLFVLFGYVTGITPSAEIGSIGTAIDPALVLFRIVPLAAGILLPLIIYCICRNLSMGRIASVVAGIFVCLENTLVIQSRFVLIDIILITTGFASLLLYLIYRNRTAEGTLARLALYGSAFLFACSVSTKWTGLFFIAPIVAYELWDVIKNKKERLMAVKRFALHACVYFLIPAALYISLFYVHFSLLPHSGPGDAFMSKRFQKTLVASKYSSDQSLSTPGFVEKFFELNIEMFQAHTRMTKTHTYSSKFYTWPLMTRPIYYWYQDEHTVPLTHSRIYLLGNPVLYWGGTLAVIMLLLMCIETLHSRKFKLLPHKPALLFVLIGFSANFLPFIFIGRVMFIYHYATALVFSLIAFSLLLEYVASETRRLQLAVLIVLLSTATFAYFSPLTYGRPLNPAEYESRVWFKTWK
jgi:dolichyl-phosphate-mannose-protein mannosyltransferase